MRKIVFLLAVVLIIISFTSCGNKINNDVPSDNQSQDSWTKEEMSSNKNTQDELANKSILGYSFSYPSKYSYYPVSHGRAIATDNVWIIVVTSAYGVNAAISQEAIMQYEDALCSNISNTFLVKCDKQIIGKYETGSINGFEYAKVSGTLKYSIDDSQQEYVAYYMLTEDNQLIYWVGVSASGYESELVSAMDIIKNNFKKAE